MKSVVEPLEGNRVKLSVEVDEQEFDRALDAAFRKIAREVRIPGFRPGKAPRRVLEARIGREAARQEALRESLPGFYAEALREADLDAIAPPEIDITAGQEDGAVAFDAVVEVRPSVGIPGYQGLQVTVPPPEVSDEDVDRQLDRLRSQFGELVSVSRPARDGDHLSIDIKAYRHDQTIEGLTADDYLYELGSGSLVPQLDEQLQGAKAGDIFRFNAPLPEGEEATFQVLVKETKEKHLPEVTDEWASEASEFDTVAELRDDIRERLLAVKRVQAQLALRDGALRAVTELVAEDPPEALVEAEVERRVHDLGHRLEAQGADLRQYLEATGQTGDQLVAEAREGAVDTVKADLALRALADAEAIECTEADLEAEMERLSERLGQKPAQLRRALEQADQMGAVRSDIRKAKALQWLVDCVDVVDEEGRPVDRSRLASPQEAPEGEEGVAASPSPTNEPETVESNA
jgi:trigger factor